MKRFSSIVFFVFICFIASVNSAFASSAGADVALGAVKAVAFAIVGLIIWGICKLIAWASSSAYKAVASSSAVKIVKDKTSEIISEHTTVEPSYYAVAEQEVDSGNVDSGLWSKALVNANGNEDARKAEYIKVRAKQLQKEKNIMTLNISPKIIKASSVGEELVIKVSSVDEELVYVRGLYPKFEVISRALRYIGTGEERIPCDVLRVQTKEGKKEFLFDISSFHGKPTR